MLIQNSQYRPVFFKSTLYSKRSLLTALLALAISACSSKSPDNTNTSPPLPEREGSVSPEPSPASVNTGSAPMLCKMQVSNPPAAVNRKIQRRNAQACVQGISLLIAPAPKACLSSGYGTRSGRAHRGIDYQSRPAGMVVAAADGVVVEKSFRQKDFGHFIVIDHGQGVYTGYAHLANVTANIQLKQRVSRGQPLGKMGATGNAAQAIHLHYEIRQGNYQKSSWWGLKPLDPYQLPEGC